MSHNYSTQINQRSSYSAEDPISVLKQLRASLGDLKHEVYNHENEIRMFEDRLQNQETTLEHLQQQVTGHYQTQSESLKANQIHLEGRMDSLDMTIKSLITDTRQLRNQTNDYVQALSQYKQKMSEMEILIETQNQHMQHLETALHSIMEILQAREAAEKAIAAKQAEIPMTYKTYKVQSGDTLEKIARTHKISVQSLREYNQLVNDKIRVGQTLSIP
jgi:LysM repeat protein